MIRPIDPTLLLMIRIPARPPFRDRSAARPPQTIIARIQLPPGASRLSTGTQARNAFSTGVRHLTLPKQTMQSSP
jgi:hypothetical protein